MLEIFLNYFSVNYDFTDIEILNPFETKRSPYDGLNTVDFEILEEQNYHLIRNITVDLKFTNTRQPEKMCPTDKVFQDLGREFAEKIKAEESNKTMPGSTTPSSQPEDSPINQKIKFPGKISIEMDPEKPLKSFVVDGVRILFEDHI